MRRASGLVCVAVALAPLAGCMGQDDLPDLGSPPDPETFGGQTNATRLAVRDRDFSAVIDPDHGGVAALHADPSLHGGAFGLDLVGYNSLTAAIASPTAKDSGFGALDTWGTYACVAQFASTGGAVIVDVSDPRHPQVTSTVESGMLNSDCQFTDDGNYLVLAAYTGLTPGLPVGEPPVADAASYGVLVYDVKDKSRPHFLFQDVQGASATGGLSNAYHNVFTATINGTIYVFQTYTGNILSFTPGESQLRMVSSVATADHDIWVGHHPVSGNWTMITGSAQGTRVYDVANPAEPKLLGEWAGHDGFAGWHRQWPLDDTVEGHALMLVAGEDCTGGNSLPYTVLDFTDPTNLEELGHWQVPGNPRAPADAHLCEFSPHEFETWDGYVATGNYHAGLWLIDIGSMERARNPVTIGYYLPDQDPPATEGALNKPFKWNPDVWGGYFDDRGYVLLADIYSGLYVLKFGATQT